MNWPQAIERNSETLLRIILALAASLGLSDGGVLKTLPRFLYNKAMRIIVPAESAVRRLILIIAHEMKLRGGFKLPKARITFTNFMLLNPLPADHIPAFNLLDPRKIFGLEAPDYYGFGGNHNDQRDDDDSEALDKTPIPAAALGRRLLALKAALENLPKQARRLARWYEQRDAAYAKNQPHLYSPVRPGLPPAYRKHNLDEIDDVMIECHSLALIALDTS